MFGTGRADWWMKNIADTVLNGLADGGPIERGTALTVALARERSMKRSIAVAVLLIVFAAGASAQSSGDGTGTGGGASAESLLVVTVVGAGVWYLLVHKKRRERRARNLLIVAADPVLSRYDDNRNARISCREARRHSIAPTSREHPAYPYLRDLDKDGIACE